MSSTDKKLTIEEAVLVLQSLDMVYLETTVEHLQLRRKTVKDLKKYNIGNLQRLIKSAECYYGKSLMYEESNIRKLWLGIEFEIEDRLSQLAHACSSGKIDWIMFWDTIGYEFTFAAAKCIIAIKFAFKSFFHCLFQFKTVLTSYQLKG